MVYKSFDELLNADTVDETARLRFTQQWLEESYGLKNFDPVWANLLSAVHDHDNLPKHFGDIRVGSAFSALITQLVRLPDGWHLASKRHDNEDLVPIHPKNEGSFSHPANQALVLRLRQTLKNGKVVVPAGAVPEFNAPVESFDIYAGKDAAETRNEGPTSAPLLSEPGKTRSVGIDLSQFPV